MEFLQSLERVRRGMRGRPKLVPPATKNTATRHFLRPQQQRARRGDNHGRTDAQSARAVAGHIHPNLEVVDVGAARRRDCEAAVLHLERVLVDPRGLFRGLGPAKEPRRPGDGSRRRRGRGVDIPRRRPVAAP